MPKMTLSEYVKNEQFNNKIQHIVSNYSDSYIEYQKYFLDWIITHIHKQKLEGKDINDIKEKIYSDTYEFLESIKHPNLSDFYMERTQSLILKDKKLLELHIESFAKKRNKLDLEKEYHFDEDMGNNIQKLIESCVNIFFEEDTCKTPEIIELKEKYINGNIDKLFVSKLATNIQKYNKSIQDRAYIKFIKRMEKNPQILCDTIFKNVNEIFEVEELGEAVDNNDEQKYCKIRHKKVRVKNIINDIYYGDDDNKNARIYIQKDFLPLLPNDSLINLYDAVKEKNLNSEEFIYQIFKKVCPMAENIFFNFKHFLCNRIKEIAKYLENLNLLQKYNETNNKRLNILGAEELKFSEEELKENLTDMSKLNSYSLEALIGLASFYSNRVTKSASELFKSIFILEKLHLFEEIYNKDEFSINDIKLTDEEVKEFVARYDLIEEAFTTCVMNRFSGEYSEEKFKEHSFNKAYKETYSKYKNEYEAKYNGEYDEDYDFVVEKTNNMKDFLYIMKTQTMQALVYTALKDNKKNIINWGYIEENKKDPDKILLGFDIQSLNMPIKLHIKREDLIYMLKNINGNALIPCYIGNEDMMNTKVGSVSTQVLSVVPKDKKRELLKNDRVKSIFINHLKWMQRPLEKPEYYKNLPDKFFDIEEGRIVNLQKTQK